VSDEPVLSLYRGRMKKKRRKGTGAILGCFKHKKRREKSVNGRKNMLVDCS